MADEAPQAETATTTTAEAPADQAKDANGKPIMAVKVYAPFKIYFEGNAYSVSAENAIGPFDILPRHHNFLCMLVPGKITVKPVEGEVKEIKIHRALMQVKSDRVVVFMDV
jgi:F0F1-type ATP synthase epsilon subunit